MPGVAPGTGCLTCEHPDAALINAALMAETLSARAIARKFGLPKDSVARHKYKRHPGYTPPLPKGAPDTTGDTDYRPEVERLKDIRNTLESEMRRAPKADLSRELRQVNQRIAELEGTDRPKSVTVADVVGLAEQVAEWFKALEPFPDAREAMWLATDRALLERAGLTEPEEES
jgi:hypothetical protein